MTADELKQMSDGLIEQLRDFDSAFTFADSLKLADALAAYQYLTTRLISQSAAQEVLIGEHIAKQREAERRAAELLNLLDDAQSYVDAFADDPEDGHIAKKLSYQIDAALSAATEDKHA